jgi:uncharacterized protein (TIGR02246 family)
MLVSAAEAQRRTSAQSAQQDRKGIEELHQKEIQANVALDVPALASLWSDDIVSLPPDGPPLVGRAANLQFLEDTAKKMADYNILSYTQDWQQVFQLDPDYAFEWGFISGRLQPAAGGKETEYRYKVLRILKREPDGSWRVHRTSWNDTLTKKEPDAAPGGESSHQ